jgi:hypothetical protein
MIVKFFNGVPGTNITTRYTVKANSYEKVDNLLSIKGGILPTEGFLLDLKSFTKIKGGKIFFVVAKLLMMVFFQMVISVAFVRRIQELHSDFTISSIVLILANLLLMIVIVFMIKSLIESWFYGGVTSKYDGIDIYFQSDDESRDFSDII